MVILGIVSIVLGIAVWVFTGPEGDMLGWILIGCGVVLIIIRIGVRMIDGESLGEALSGLAEDLSDSIADGGSFGGGGD